MGKRAKGILGILDASRLQFSGFNLAWNAVSSESLSCMHIY